MAFPIELNLAIVDSDSTYSSFLESILKNKIGLKKTAIFNNTLSAKSAFENTDLNGLIIDIFSVGVKDGIDLINHIRTDYQHVPVCLYCTKQSFASMVGVDDHWRGRFQHYYKLFKDQTPADYELTLPEILYHMSTYLLSRMAKTELSNLRNEILHHGVNNKLSDIQIRQIEMVTKVAEKALEAREKGHSTKFFLPGISHERIEHLVDGTLEEARKSLLTTSRVNIGILVFGAGLLLASFIVSIFWHGWEAVTFGGFGIAGIIASLITNPLKSISMGARRLVQVHIAYLAFLSQLTMLNRVCV